MTLQLVATNPTYTTDDFLALFGGPKQFFRVIHDQKLEDKPKLNKQDFYANIEPKLRKLNDEGYGIFFCVNQVDRKGDDKHVSRIRAVFVDLDGAPLEPVLECGLDPSCIVQTSPGKYHVYWLVDGVPVDKFRLIQQQIARRFNGDLQCKNPSRLLRLPGFYHRKGEPFLSHITHLNPERRYTMDDIISGLNLDIVKLYDKKEFTNFTCPNVIMDGTRNTTLFRVGCSLRARGAEREQIQAELEKTNDERCRPPLPSITSIVNSIMRYPAGEIISTSLPDNLGLGKEFFPDAWAMEFLKSNKLFFDGAFYRFNGQFYPEEDVDIIEGGLRSLGRGLLKKGHCDEILRSLRVLIKSQGQPERDPAGVLCLENCILDTTKGVGMDHSEKYFLTHKVGVSFQKGADCPLWKKTVAEILPDPVAQVVLQKYVGYTLTSDVSFHTALFMQGSGSNGKSLVIEVVQALLGRKNYETLEMENLTSQFMLHNIRGKLANFSSEVKVGKLKGEHLFKKLVDGSVITADRKNREAISFSSYAKLWIASNPMIDSADCSPAFLRRFIFLKFAERFEGKRVDRNRAKRIIRDELPGVLNWAVEGLEKLRIHGGFEPLPKCHHDLLADVTSYIDPRADYINMCFKENTKSETKVYLKDIFADWKSYAEATGRKVGSDRKWKQALEQRFPGIRTDNGKHGRWFSGLVFTPYSELLSENDDVPF